MERVVDMMGNNYSQNGPFVQLSTFPTHRFFVFDGANFHKTTKKLKGGCF